MLGAGTVGEEIQDRGKSTQLLNVVLCGKGKLREVLGQTKLCEGSQNTWSGRDKEKKEGGGR